jgi:hypothetical protein
MKRIYELENGARFIWNGETYTRGMRLTVRGYGVVYMCHPEAINGKRAVERPFNGNLEVEEVK